MNTERLTRRQILEAYIEDFESNDQEHTNDCDGAKELADAIEEILDEPSTDKSKEE